MNVYTENSEIDCSRGSVVTVGTFDGIHEGHKSLIEILLQVSYKTNLMHFIVTFEPHPRMVLGNKDDVKLITTLDEKLEIFKLYGIESVLIIKFTEEFSKISYEDFIKKYIVEKLNVKYFLIGHDHRFGKNREGDENKLLELAKEYNFNVIAVPPMVINNEAISSSLIRNLINKGELNIANTYLGRHFKLEGIVVEGSKRGRELGFPTINLKIAEEKIIPFNGVYAVTCIINGREYFGMMNVGNRPTFDNLPTKTVEINLFDFNKEIYGETVLVTVYDFIRDEVKFSRKEDLIEQLYLDRATIRNYLSIETSN
ncbi:MAG TPA: bifunctional riboflavin kinase/FAD synthetase [Melioribacteraceae bacterium]|nr:bifunctional riboflavin kinase/FAD synthetase [Melioribacteraceae bacterium]